MWATGSRAAIGGIFKIDAGYTYLNTKLQELAGIPDDELVPWEPGASSWARVVPTAVVGGPLSLRDVLFSGSMYIEAGTST